MVVKDEYLQQFVFHFNPYTKKWNGFHRDHYIKYLNGMGGEYIFSEDSMGKLLKCIKIKHATT